MKKTADFPIFTEPDDALKALALSLRHYRSKFGPDIHPPTRFGMPTGKEPGIGKQPRTVSPGDSNP